MPVLDINDFKGHRSSPVNGIHVTAGGAEAGMTAKRDIFEIPTARAGIHGATKGRIAVVYHFFYILNDRVTRVLDIKHFFIMISKNVL